jgi:hypothetical protein
MARFLDVQADLFADLRTPMTRLDPVFSVEGKSMVMVTTEVAGIPVAALGPRSPAWRRTQVRSLAPSTSY